MTGNLQMGNNQITGLSNPNGNDHAVNKKYADDNYLNLDGSKQINGDLKMNDNRITGIPNTPISSSDAINKNYLDNAVKMGLLKPSHTAKNVFEYVTKDILEFSTEYGVNVIKIDDLDISPHFWDKRCLYLSPTKRSGSYMWRIGIQCFRLVTNQTYTLVIELNNKDLLLYIKQKFGLKE